MAKKKISTSDLKKLFKEAHKLDPMKPVPKSVANRMDATIARLAAEERASNKPLSKMSNAEIKARKAVLKNKAALSKNKLVSKNKATVNKIRGLMSGRGGGGGGAGLGGPLSGRQIR